MTVGFPHSKLLKRLNSLVALSAADSAAIAGLPMTLRNVSHQHDIVVDGMALNQCCLLVDGFLIRHKTGQDARRQIVSFHVPGDIPDLYSLHLNPVDHTLTTLGQAVVAFIPHGALQAMLERSRSLTHILWRETLVDAAIFREWVVSIGTRDALARVAHILCELALRLGVVGLAPDRRFPFPGSQTDMADACGISAVHANRMIQELRARGLIEWDNRVVKIRDWAELVQVADFDPDYLHLRGPLDVGE